MGVFLLIPAITLVLWLGHAGLAIAGSPATRYTRWVLFGGLPVVAAVMLLSGGMAGFILALITALTWLGTILLEVFLSVGSMVARDARAKKAV
jgi:putative Ca2+/H+ antiporter (TMEM165/GDT1 family)